MKSLSQHLVSATMRQPPVEVESKDGHSSHTHNANFDLYVQHIATAESVVVVRTKHEQSVPLYSYILCAGKADVSSLRMTRTQDLPNQLRTREQSGGARRHISPPGV